MKQVLIAFLALLAATLACISPTSAPPAVTVPPTRGATPVTEAAPVTGTAIGSVTQKQGSVEAGPENALRSVSPKRDMYENDAVHVFDSGEAELDFGYGMVLVLYNDTKTAGTKVSGSGQVIAKLMQGGLRGFTPEGNRTEFQLPNKCSVVILGTHYCLVYDPASGVATVCNFDGTVSYS